jgi:hypothetical protein
MEVFSDPKTRLAFPTKLGSLNREHITTYEQASAGYSVAYLMRGWLGGVKLCASLDVYDKGLSDIPDGPNSPHVAVELQNNIHIFNPASPLPTISEIEPFLSGSRDDLSYFAGEISGYFRIVSLEAKDKTVLGLFLTGHREHFIKIVAVDMTGGRSLSYLAPLIDHIHAQILRETSNGKETIPHAIGSGRGR